MRSMLKFVYSAGSALTISALLQTAVMAQAAPAPAQGQGRGGGAAPAGAQQGRGGGAGGAGRGGGAPQPLVWAPKPTTLTPYTGVHKPHTKLADVLAAHRGQQSWSQTIVDDNQMLAKYISMAPGESTGMRMHADQRVSWIVWDGQMRVTIQGQEPFLASKGYMVQVPYQTPYKMETVGNVPSLRFEILPAHTATLYLENETPPPTAGVTWVKTRATMRNATYTEPERMVLNFADVQAGTQRGGAFVSDDRSFVNIIRGAGIARQPDTALGHFHLEYAEFWFIMEGNISYLIEGLDFFESSPGDIVYVPNGRWHRAGFGGTVGAMATRIAINGFPQGLHVMEAPGITPTPVR